MCVSSRSRGNEDISPRSAAPECSQLKTKCRVARDRAAHHGGPRTLLRGGTSGKRSRGCRPANANVTVHGRALIDSSIT